jgi:hypothetical protein
VKPALSDPVNPADDRLKITRDADGTVRWSGGGSQSPGSFKRTGAPRTIRDAFGGTAVEGNTPGFVMDSDTDSRQLQELARQAQIAAAKKALREVSGLDEAAAFKDEWKVDPTPTNVKAAQAIVDDMEWKAKIKSLNDAVQSGAMTPDQYDTAIGKLGLENAAKQGKNYKANVNSFDQP